VKTANHFQLIGLTILLLALIVPGHVMAQSPAEFGREYGLYVHDGNRSAPVPKDRGMQVLRSFFPDGLLKDDETNRQFLNQREFLLLFEKRRMSVGKETVKLSDDSLYHQFWLKARRQNWLPDSRLTYGSLQEFLYRYSVSEKHGGIAYYEGLVLDEKEINATEFPSIRQVREIIKKLTAQGEDLKKLVKPTEADRLLRSYLDKYRQAFGVLEEELKSLQNPLNLIPDLPEDIKQKIIANDLNEILSTISYDYSRNTSNRIHNLTVGLSKISGQVYQPGDTIDITKEVSRDGWNMYKYGWVLVGGGEAWQFGGGLCGVATVTFTPSWWAGLDIIKRWPHSSYYRNLYPTESLGIDATIYRGGKNLILKNSLSSPILYYVKDDKEKKEVTMYVIGNSDYANIEIEGPISLGRNTYKWIRRMEGFDGKVTEDELTTRYGAIY
jgi:hypothetical protein